MIEIAHLASTMIPIAVTELDGYGTIGAAKISKRENPIVEIEKSKSALVKPIVAGVVYNDVKYDTDWIGNSFR
jgi:hypothetical protein